MPLTSLSDKPLQGKIAVVTGAGTGLGKQLAIQLAAAGCSVAILGRTLEPLQKLAKDVGKQIYAIQADVANPDDVRRAFDQIDSHFGPCDILINNAALYKPCLIDEASDSDIHDQIVINMVGPAYCMREAVKRMKPKKAGDIINLSSESARNPYPFLTLYAASKNGLETLSTGQRRELAPHGIRVMVMRVGAMVGEDSNVNTSRWGEGQIERANETWAKTGHLTFAGSGMQLTSVATLAINALKTPRDINLDLIEARSADAS